MDLKRNEVLKDTLVDVKFSGISWYKDEGFYYSSYDKPKGSFLSSKTDQHKLFYHKIGTNQQTSPWPFDWYRFCPGRVNGWKVMAL